MAIVAKPWGNYATLVQEKGYQVKRIEVNSNHRLSLQTHEKRAEKWTVVSGRAEVTLGERVFVADIGTVIEIPKKMPHRIKNIGTSSLIFIEVQIGDYLGEDDIVRLQDDYNR